MGIFKKSKKVKHHTKKVKHCKTIHHKKSKTEHMVPLWW
jgi:hypothetical protein